VTQTATKLKHPGRPRTYHKSRPATDAERARRHRQKLSLGTHQKPARRSQIWETPAATFEAWNALYHFTVDVCALPGNAKCLRYFTPEQDGLHQEWGREICWMNPPYTRYIIDRWIRKAYEASKAGATVVCLLPVSPSATWWKTYVKPKLMTTDVVFSDDRLKFDGSGNNAKFNSVVVIFRPPIEH
jgi:phage N-6-adenine-methyltransferase